MPLSDDEQRVLQEIEQIFYADDPSLADEIGSHSVYAHLLRQMKRAGLLFVLGVLVPTIALATTLSFLVAFAGFVVLLGAALWFERSLRKLGRAGMDHISDNLKRKGGVLNVLGFGESPFGPPRGRRRTDESEEDWRVSAASATDACGAVATRADGGEVGLRCPRTACWPAGGHEPSVPCSHRR